VTDGRPPGFSISISIADRLQQLFHDMRHLRRRLIVVAVAAGGVLRLPVAGTPIFVGP
jgi:hypothetical protein